MSSSTLVETVSINLEDFNESFLTCATCLCPYDQRIHKAKLLSCSHTVCILCLERIAQLPQARDTGSFRCPICREAHQIPLAGIVQLPPSFLVNQLIDLMQSQRRDVVPKCSAHPGEELLFCETCDTVFCNVCSDPADANNSCHNHTIVPFSIAIKRMSEILLYKANQCVRNLNKANDNVQTEMALLDKNVDTILDQVNQSFQDLSQLLEARRRELIENVRKTRDEKRKVLQEQLGIVQGEKAKVEQQCNGLHYQVEVRHITRKISDLNEKLDTTLTLVEPRENAFLKYDSSTQDVLKGIQAALAHFGTLSVSRTFPPLCTAVVYPSSVHLESVVFVTTIDYNGQPRTNGGDPVEARLTPEDGENQGHEVGVTVHDNDDGTYELFYRPPSSGKYRMSIHIFGRSIKSSPFPVFVSPHHPPVSQFGSFGSDLQHLCQPVRVTANENYIYVLDTGNNRVKVLMSDGTFVKHLSGEGLMQQAAVGLAIIPGPNKGILTLNWRTRSVTECTVDGREQRSFSFSEFSEPIDLAVDSRGRILVADNGARKVFVFDHQARPLFSFPLPSTNQQPPSPSRGRSVPAPPPITCVAVGMNDDIVVGYGSQALLYDNAGKLIRAVQIGQSAKSSALIGGLAVERNTGTILATVTEKQRSFVAVCQYKGELKFTIDSFGAKLKRPSGICVKPDRKHCVVADLGNHSIKEFRFK